MAELWRRRRRTLRVPERRRQRIARQFPRSFARNGQWFTTKPAFRHTLRKAHIASTENQRYAGVLTAFRHAAQKGLGVGLIVLARRIVAFSKLLVMAAGAATALCMGALVSLQFGFWLMTRTWSPFPVSRFFELLDVNIPRRYVPASIDRAETGHFDSQSLIESVLDLPAIVVLFVALALVALSYAALAAFDKRLAGSET